MNNLRSKTASTVCEKLRKTMVASQELLIINVDAKKPM
jgi:hypothetical protein